MLDTINTAIIPKKVIGSNATQANAQMFIKQRKNSKIVQRKLLNKLKYFTCKKGFTEYVKYDEHFNSCSGKPSRNNTQDGKNSEKFSKTIKKLANNNLMDIDNNNKKIKIVDASRIKDDDVRELYVSNLVTKIVHNGVSCTQTSQDGVPYLRKDLFYPENDRRSAEEKKEGKFKDEIPQERLLTSNPKIYLLGKSALCCYNRDYNAPEYTYQLVEIEKYKAFQEVKPSRSSAASFGKNQYMPEDQQKAPKAISDSDDRGHSIAFLAATCEEDQNAFQRQGNIFSQD